MDLKELEAKLRANPELAKKLYLVGKKYNFNKYRKNPHKDRKENLNEQEKVLRG